MRESATCSGRKSRLPWAESPGLNRWLYCQSIGDKAWRPSLVQAFAEVTKAAQRLGCATPNPIAALVVSRVVEGTMFVGECSVSHRVSEGDSTRLF